MYVDELKLAGRETELEGMWNDLRKYLKLDPPTELHKSVYLGCQQEDFTPTTDELDYQRAFYSQTFADDNIQFKTATDTLLTELRASNISKRQLRKEAKRQSQTVSSTIAAARKE